MIIAPGFTFSMRLIMRSVNLKIRLLIIHITVQTGGNQASSSADAQSSRTKYSPHLGTDIHFELE